MATTIFLESALLDDGAGPQGVGRVGLVHLPSLMYQNRSKSISGRKGPQRKMALILKLHNSVSETLEFAQISSRIFQKGLQHGPSLATANRFLCRVQAWLGWGLKVGNIQLLNLPRLMPYGRQYWTKER